jgi:HSP20 family protein
MERTNATAPAINVKESQAEFEVQVAAPGMTKNDFSIRIDEDNNLVIAMERKAETKTEDRESRYLRREFSYSKFMQTMILPDNVDKDKIAAKMEDGILEIRIPKRSEEEIKKAQRTIEIG